MHFEVKCSELENLRDQYSTLEIADNKLFESKNLLECKYLNLIEKDNELLNIKNELEIKYTELNEDDNIEDAKRWTIQQKLSLQTGNYSAVK